MTEKETIARANHKKGYNCSQSVYMAFSGSHADAPAPRSDGGKCGAYLAGKALLEKRSPQVVEAYTQAFLEKNGAIECRKLRGLLGGKCNDYVGDAARLVEELTHWDQESGICTNM